jgi:hypothetical protein
MTPAELQELRRKLDKASRAMRTGVSVRMVVDIALLESCRTALDELIDTFGS